MTPRKIYSKINLTQINVLCGSPNAPNPANLASAYNLNTCWLYTNSKNIL